MEYQIVRAISSRELESKVRAEIGEGWRPLGGPISFREINIPDWNQALIRDEKDRPPEEPAESTNV